MINTQKRCSDQKKNSSDFKTCKIFFFFFKFYVLMQFMTMKHDAIYLNSHTEALCIS